MFSEKYIHARDKENRIYTDSEVAMLPDINPTHPHYKEWQIRKASTQKLISYLTNKHQQLDILEIGCGNGWLSGRLATIKNTTVLGIDVNELELEQASRVFKSCTNLQFANIDIKNQELKDQSFDIIIFAASIQYFPSLTNTIKAALKYLKPNGEIHVIDTPLYKFSKLLLARQRTLDYYLSIGCPEMGDFYFHHNREQLKRFDHKILYDPSTLMNKLYNKSPFPWIVIRSEIAVSNKGY